MLRKKVHKRRSEGLILKPNMEYDKSIGSEAYENTSEGVAVFIKQEPLMLEDHDSEEYKDFSKSVEVTSSISERLFDDGASEKINKEECLEDASYNERVLCHIGEQYESVNAATDQFIIDSSKNKSQEEFILPDKIDNIHTIIKTLKEEPASYEKITETLKETSFEENLRPISLKEELGIFNKVAAEQLTGRDLRPKMCNVYKLGVSICEGSSSGEYTPEEFTSKQSQYPVEKNVISEESSCKEQTSEGSDTDEQNCDDVHIHSSREVWKRRLEWSVAEVERHLQRKMYEVVDEEDKMYSCNICEKTFVSYDCITHHLKFTHSHKYPFLCEICGKAFKMKCDLKKHSLIHNNELPFSYQVCSKSFCRKASLVDHQLMLSGHKRYSCKHCDKGFKRKVDFEKHQPLHDGKKVWKCDECPESFMRWKEVVEHSEAHRQRNEFSCDICGNKFRMKCYLRKHMLTHILPHQCDICEKHFSCASKLKIHIRTHTGDKPFPCTVCEKRFIRKDNLVQHVQSHTGERPFQCTFCEKDFVRKRDMVEHMQSHTGERPFSCTLCEKRFVRKRDMVKHMRFHTGEKPFPCTVCEKRFVRNQYLVLHMRTHTGEKPYACENCDLAFSMKCSLIKHLERKHSQKLPFRCEKCVLCFDQSKKLQEHKKNMHSKALQK